jgi:cell cycle checkpoint control protein RAD9A
MNLSLAIRFTDPTAPLYIDIDGENDCAETLFVISTSQVHGAPARTSNPANHITGGSKRGREERTVTPVPSKKLVRAVYPVDTSLNAPDDRMRAQSRPTTSPAFPPSFSGEARIPSQTNSSQSLPRELDNREPLFLPPSPHIHGVGLEGLPLPSAAINPLDVAASSTRLRGTTFHSDVEMELEATQKGSERINVSFITVMVHTISAPS